MSNAYDLKKHITEAGRGHGYKALTALDELIRETMLVQDALGYGKADLATKRALRRDLTGLHELKDRLNRITLDAETI